MSHLRALVALVLAVALTPLLLTAPGTAAPVRTGAAGSTDTSAYNTARKAQSARLTVLPKIAQKGKSAAGADRAKAVGEVKVTPATEDRKVVIQRSSDAGGTWSTFGSAKKTNAKGIVYFTPAATTAGTTWTYRAKVAKQKSLPAFTTGQAADRWSMIFEDQFAGSSLEQGHLVDPWRLLRQGLQAQVLEGLAEDGPGRQRRAHPQGEEGPRPPR